MKFSKYKIAFFSLIILPILIIGSFVILSPKPILLENTSFSTAYYDRGNTLLRLSLAKDQSYRIYTKLEDMSDDLIIATLTQEDRYFYYHFGMNPASLFRGAYETYIRRSRPIGGSTITMQVVRLRDGLNTTTVYNKLVQIMRAMQLEWHYSKKDILETYLNLAPYGGNINGAGTASIIYFKQPVKNLALSQSLALAVIPQNPVKRFPLRQDNSEWNKARKRLFDLLPAKDYAEYSDLIQMGLTVSSRQDLPFLTPHFINSLARQKSDNSDNIVSTTIDLHIQKTFEQRLTHYLEYNKSFGFDNASIMLLHFPTMEVRALIGSSDFFNRAIHGQVDGTLARRSPGSTLKPFVYALALEQGLIHPETLLEDDVTFFAEYRPGNFDKRFIGSIPAREALTLSRNIPAISLAQRLREPNIYDFLQKSGADFPKKQGHYGLSIVVGGAEIDMRRLTKLYAMLANGGKLQDIKYTPTTPITEPVSILSPESALLTLNMLDRQRPNTLPFTPSRKKIPVYWKTGTSNGFRDAWSIGVFGPYVLAVWVGHFDGHANSALIGSRAATPLFFDLVQDIENETQLKDHIAPAMAELNIAPVLICPKTGEIGDCDIKKESLFIPGKSPFSIQSVTSKPIEIISPREHISYAYSYKHKDKLIIPLEAKSKDGTSPLYWFANTRYLGKTENRAPLFWVPKPGEHIIRVIDDIGHAASKKIMVIVSE